MKHQTDLSSLHYSHSLVAKKKPAYVNFVRLLKTDGALINPLHLVSQEDNMDVKRCVYYHKKCHVLKLV